MGKTVIPTPISAAPAPVAVSNEEEAQVVTGEVELSTDEGDGELPEGATLLPPDQGTVLGDGSIVQYDPEKGLTKYTPSKEDIVALDQILVGGDFSVIAGSSAENARARLMIVARKCQSLGVDIAHNPYVWAVIGGKLILMPTKHLGEQLRAIHDVSVDIVEEWLDPGLGIYYVKMRGVRGDGRYAYNIGVAGVGSGRKTPDGDFMMTKGGDLANAIKVAYTQCESRLSQALCGSGGLGRDETLQVRQVNVAGEMKKITPREIPEAARFEKRGVAALVSLPGIAVGSGGSGVMEKIAPEAHVHPAVQAPSQAVPAAPAPPAAPIAPPQASQAAQGAVSRPAPPAPAAAPRPGVAPAPQVAQVGTSVAPVAAPRPTPMSVPVAPPRQVSTTPAPPRPPVPAPAKLRTR